MGLGSVYIETRQTALHVCTIILFADSPLIDGASKEIQSSQLLRVMYLVAQHWYTVA